MSVQFYPAYTDTRQDHLDILYLDAGSANAIGIFKMLGVKGKGKQGTVGGLNHPQILEALMHMDEFVREERWVDFGWDHNQMRRYVTMLNLILGFCLGNKCEFRWS